MAHYRFDLRVGAGEHDVIGRHRIVRERAPWVPETGRRGVFMVPGDGRGFEANFLAGTTTPDEDWGHDDPFLAEAAREVLWQPILDWIDAH